MLIPGLPTYRSVGSTLGHGEPDSWRVASSPALAPEIVTRHHDVPMRTTLTLDDDVAVLLREEADRSRRPFRQVVNQVLRLGLSAAGAPSAREPFRTKARSLGLRPGFDPDKMNQLAGELEDEAILDKLRKDQRRAAAWRPTSPTAGCGFRPSWTRTTATSSFC